MDRVKIPKPQILAMLAMSKLKTFLRKLSLNKDSIFQTQIFKTVPLYIFFEISAKFQWYLASKEKLEEI